MENKQLWYHKAVDILKRPIGQSRPSIQAPSTAYVEQTLCRNCVKFLSQIASILRKPESDIRLHHQDIVYCSDVEYILGSAETGCHLCSIFVGQTWLDGKCRYSEAKSRILTLPQWTNGESFTIRLYGKRTRSTSSAPAEALLQLDLPFAGCDSLHVVKLNPEQAERRVLDRTRSGVPQPPLCRSTGDSEVLQLAAWWLQRCLKDHDLCRNSSTMAPDMFPARLLYVGNKGSTHSDGELRLHTLQSGQAVPDYVCLSYCWGASSQNCEKLLSTNLDDFA